MQSDRTNPEAIGHTEADAPPPTILLVDDQCTVLQALGRVFRHEGYRLFSAQDANTALDILERERCDVVIVDYLMPDVNGIDLLTRIRDRWPHVARIMLTGRPDLSVVTDAIRNGLLFKFALKPWDDRDLREAVTEALGAATRRPVQPAPAVPLIREKPLDLGWVYDLYLAARRSAVDPDVGSGKTALLKHIVEVFSATSGSLAEFDPRRRTLTIVSGIDLPDHLIGSTVPIGSGIIGWVAEHGTPLLLNGDLSSDPRFRQRIRRAGGAPDSAMCWPLIVEDETVGVISINRGLGQPPFAAEDLYRGFDAVRFIAVAVENARLHERSARYVRELEQALQQIEESRPYLIRTEKMALLGRLAAGVAHEINNPIGYVGSNLAVLREYVADLMELLRAYEAADPVIRSDPNLASRIAAVRKDRDITRIEDDACSLVDESIEGVRRVCSIVRGLKEFSHIGSDEWALGSLHTCLESTLGILDSQIRYKATIVREYGELPLIDCIVSKLEQVFMNLLINAAQAIEGRGVITLRTGLAGDWVWAEVSDTGSGITPEDLPRIFEPFYTTKPVGVGTGLGLPLSHGIVEQHGGRMEVQTQPGSGSTFRVWLPIARPDTGATGPSRIRS